MCLNLPVFLNIIVNTIQCYKSFKILLSNKFYKCEIFSAPHITNTSENLTIIKGIKLEIPKVELMVTVWECFLKTEMISL